MCSEESFLLSVRVGFDDLQVCADPGIPENGFRTPSGGVFFESSVTRFHCQDGFKLKGSTKRLCMKHLNGTLGWIPSDRPVCVQEGKVVPSTPTPTSWKLLLWSARGRGGTEAVCYRDRFPGLLSVSGLVQQADGEACVLRNGWGRG